MEHVGIVVNDLPAAIAFFVELGLEPGGKGQAKGSWVDRIIALEGVKAELAMLRTPDGQAEIELVKFHSPPTQPADPQAPSNTPGLRHLVQYENSYRLCYIRDPEGIIIELAEKVG